MPTSSIQQLPSLPEPLEVQSLPTSKPLTLPALLLKTTLLALGIFLVMVVLTLIGVGVWGWGQYQKFLSAAELSHQDVISLYQESQTTNALAESGRTVILVLGIDTVANKSAPPLTDTILLASIDAASGAISLLSLPRDLWSDAYITKINSLYYYGLERFPDRPEQFVEESLEEMTGVPIDYTLVFSLSQVEEVIDLFGGVEVEIPVGFIDQKFPREDIDLDQPLTDEELYQTIEFEPGRQQLDSTRALQYIRSRHSVGDTGTDDDRMKRQQLVIRSFVDQTSIRSLLASPELAGHLLRWYVTNFERSLPLVDATVLVRDILPHLETLEFQQNTLPVFPDVEDGVIENPPLQARYQNQWIYRIRELGQFQEFAQTALLDTSSSDFNLEAQP